MQTNQIFNFSRFGRYTKSSLILNYRQLLIFWGGMASAIFLLYLLTSISNELQIEVLSQPFIIIFFLAGIVFAGISFPAFRKKEKTLAMLCIPASAVEKFFYEFLEKIIAFFTFYPLLFNFASNLAIFIRNTIGRGKTVSVGYTVDGVLDRIHVFPYSYFSLTRFINTFENGQLLLFLSTALLLFSIAFAGAATFKRYPLIKTIALCGILVATVVGYFYIVIAKFGIRNPWIANMDFGLTAKQGFEIVSAALLFLSLIIFFYSFFKVKEKEAQ